ncbi:hypothetical protein HOLleu_16988 [Holothuria leucospilota]|uniref:Uncharacterized protein n=1 Tax=Holothuria leucospilota TaxID=206669 RepID=A0A9Q1HBM4_HOLLE|nr:hypothetical protein HOLleu_16988 [Holothuria leucospilota]
MTYGYDIRRVPRLRDDDDIDVYLRAFELLAEGNGWDKSQWAKLLVPSLSGKTRDVYANLSVADSPNYDALKTAIPAKYEINAESYRIKFRNTCRVPTRGVQGAKPPEALAILHFKSTEIGSSSYVSEILYLVMLHGI